MAWSPAGGPCLVKPCSGGKVTRQAINILIHDILKRNFLGPYVLWRSSSPHRSTRSVSSISCTSNAIGTIARNLHQTVWPHQAGDDNIGALRFSTLHAALNPAWTRVFLHNLETRRPPLDGENQVPTTKEALPPLNAAIDAPDLARDKAGLKPTTDWNETTPSGAEGSTGELSHKLGRHIRAEEKNGCVGLDTAGFNELQL